MFLRHEKRAKRSSLPGQATPLGSESKETHLGFSDWSPGWTHPPEFTTPRQPATGSAKAPPRAEGAQSPTGSSSVLSGSMSQAFLNTRPLPSLSVLT